jgi:hypothetical protein
MLYNVPTMTTVISSFITLGITLPERFGVFCVHHLQGHLLVSASMVILVHIHHYICLCFP